MALVLLLASLPLSAGAATLDLAFVPPEIAPQDLCLPTTEVRPDDPEAGAGEDTEERRLLLFYLLRDLRGLSAEDPDRWFDFLMTLIDWRAELDPDFDAVDVTLARIALHVDAGRLAALAEAGLVPSLRSDEVRLDNAQRMQLAQYYLNGIGVAPDLAYAQFLIREAAYGGNVDALMSVARFGLMDQPVPGWDAPLDLTVTLAFGGMLGAMNEGVCARAERIAREYLSGEVVTRNPEIALAWYKFAADLGGATAAWRVVEFHLEADALRKDQDEMLHYLRLAAARGFSLDDAQTDRLRSAAGVDAATVGQILGWNFSADTERGRPSLTHHMALSVNLDAEEAAEDGPYLTYLRAVAEFPTAPGFVFTRLAEETLIREGRWAGEAEAMALLAEGWRRGDPEATRRLGQMTVRFRDDPARLAEAANLLTEAAERHGMAAALNDLDALFRCQANDAPRLAEADYWRAAYDASGVDPVTVSATDLITLDPFRNPLDLAVIQSQALGGQVQSLANWTQRMQLDPFATEDGHRLWARRVAASDKALELFAELEFTLATTPAERDLAVEFFRRVYLNNGVTTALDLSVALVEDAGRDPAVAAEIRDLLTQAGNRGEGAAIRLLARVSRGVRTEAEVYAEFADEIEERGDFLALMFAIPHVDPVTAADYIDRAVSLMTCGTKDADELGDAYAILGDSALSDHWRRIGLTMEWGHVLSKLALSDRQMEAVDTRPPPSEREVLERRLAEGDLRAQESLYALTADPDLQTWDPAAAAGHLLAILARGTPADDAFVLQRFRTAPPEVRAGVEAQVDIVGLYERAATGGDPRAALDLGLLLQTRAGSAAQLTVARTWLERAATGGEIAAMTELGRMLALGLGGPPDRGLALAWLDQAARAGDPDAAELARLLRAAE